MYRILCFGDSITYGTWDSSHIGWSGRLREQVEKDGDRNRLFNLGISGETTTQLLKRIKNECEARVDTRKPYKYIITIATGTNDAKGRPNPLTEEELKNKIKIYKKELKKCIKIAQQFTTEVYVIGLTPVDETKTSPGQFTSGPAYFSNKAGNEFNQAAKSVAMNMNTKFIDVREAFEKQNFIKLLADGLHPNSKGYDLMYEVIRKELNL